MDELVFFPDIKTRLYHAEQKHKSAAFFLYFVFQFLEKLVSAHYYDLLIDKKSG